MERKGEGRLKGDVEGRREENECKGNIGREWVGGPVENNFLKIRGNNKFRNVNGHLFSE